MVLDVYAVEVANGGDACVADLGHEDNDHDHDDHAETPTSTATVPHPPAESTGCVLHEDHYHCAGPASPEAAAPSATETAAQSCHTHADGSEFQSPDRGRVELTDGCS